MRSRTALIVLIGLFVFGLLIKATGPELGEERENELICDGSLHTKVGEDVTLDCYHKSQRDVTDESIVWKFNKTISVLVYRSRKVSPQDQAKQFKDRASQDSSWNPSKGKLAVKISRVNTSDHGVYTCSVGKGPNKISCSTTLYIQFRAPEQDSVTQPNRTHGDEPSVTEQQGMDPGSIIGIIFAIIGVIVIIGIGIVFYFKKPTYLWTRWREWRHGRTRTRTESGRLSDPAAVELEFTVNKTPSHHPIGDMVPGFQSQSSNVVIQVPSSAPSSASSSSSSSSPPPSGRTSRARKRQKKNAKKNQGTEEEMTELKGDPNAAPEAGASSGSKSSV